MKHAREIKVGVLAAICLFLLFFGFNFLKGVNVFSPTNPYHGKFENIHGLEEQAAVYIRGYKVGHVDAIRYDFTQDTAFIVDISINKDIVLPQGTNMVLFADGLLGGMAIDLQLPESQQEATIERGAFLTTVYQPGLMDKMQSELLAKVDSAVVTIDKTVQDVDSLIAVVQGQLEGDHIKNTLVNVDRVSADLTGASRDIKVLMAHQVPQLLRNADTALTHLNAVIADVEAADLQATVARIDTAIEGVNTAITRVPPILNNVNAAVVSADSLLVDLKAHPKRYVHFSLFGKKEK